MRTIKGLSDFKQDIMEMGAILTLQLNLAHILNSVEYRLGIVARHIEKAEIEELSHNRYAHIRVAVEGLQQMIEVLEKDLKCQR
jgi:hypothetical protein